MTDRPHLLGMLPQDLAEYLRGRGVAIRDAESRRIQGHVVTRGLEGFPTGVPVPRKVEQAVDALIDREPLEVLERAHDPVDGFEKYLFRSPDGALSEAVRIPLHKEDRYSICLSSQVGCGMGCQFCATGRLGFTRNLRAWEIVSAFQIVRQETPGRVTGAVFQGQGEPLLNEAEVLQAARVLCDPCGCSIRATSISISTVGIVPAIRRYTEARLPYRLIVSLTSTDDERRAQLMPGAGHWTVAELADALRERKGRSRGRITVAWVMLGGVNHDASEVEGLRRLMGDLPLRINLIDVNDIRPDGFRQATADELQAFRDELQVLGVPVVRRYSGGTATHAACGMLASKRTT